jgi:hypothetical protein
MKATANPLRCDHDLLDYRFTGAGPAVGPPQCF